MLFTRPIFFSSSPMAEFTGAGQHFRAGSFLSAWREQIVTRRPNHFSLSSPQKDGAVPLLLQRGNTAMGNYA